MSTPTGAPGFTGWAEPLLAGTGWSLGTVRTVTVAGGADLASAALADGFAAAAHAARVARGYRDGGQ